MLGKREKQILKLLFEQKPAYLTGQTLAHKLEVSNKTARKYLELLETSLQATTFATIEAKRGNGYRLQIMDEANFAKFYLQEVKQKDITEIKEASDRQDYILNRLLFEQEASYVDDLASELFVSRSTLSKELAEIKDLLKPYQIRIESKCHRGIYLVGNEKNIRRFIIEYFFKDRLQDNLFAFSEYSNLLEGVMVDEIVLSVLEECRKAQLKLSDLVIYNLVLHLGLAIKRIQNGFAMDLQTPLDLEPSSLEYQTAVNILERLEAKMYLKFADKEAEFVALHLKSEQGTAQILQQTKLTKNEIKLQLVQVLQILDQELELELAQDQILLDGLMLHFIPLLARLQQCESLENPLLSEIKAKHPEILTLTIKYFSQMPLFEQYHMTEDEWAYLALHVIAALERHYNAQKVRVLVICATGQGSAQMIKNRLEHEFGAKLNIQDVISYYEFSKYDLSGIDLVISALNLGNMVFNVPVVQVSVFLSEEDIHQINYFLGKKKSRFFQVEKPVLPEEIDISAIRSGFSEELFYFSNIVQTKEQVLAELTARIAQVEQCDRTTELLKQLKLRESYSSVVFSQYMAVPHPVEAVTDAGHVAVAVVPQGIMWDEEHRDIQLVFLLSPDKLGDFAVDKVSQQLVKVMEDDELRQTLVASPDFTSFIQSLLA
ncbi:BglG family transcription antiterminator [Ligilactobacillus animalis]|jgi:lichenan operon transcriptional antiterminator|uniref:BglG family transcription antiterminator n=1 Tax=Ligilactobacillus animalis TaxID=1605 RepID=UPI002592B7E9|nr:BglG family transcription antiterminator [Ligilactobacillus animalis]